MLSSDPKQAVRALPLPKEYRQPIPRGNTFFKLTRTLSDLKLHTVCEEAKCPNRTDCYGRGTLTLQILGDVCTRRCGFCAETTGTPGAVDWTEPRKILEAARRLNLKHVVLTAPARDDLADGGAAVFAGAVRLIKRNLPETTVEVLTSDLEGNASALREVLEAGPDVFNHNVETVPRLTPRVRAKATYARSLQVLRAASEFFKAKPGGKVKSGVMVGLGETKEELAATFGDMSAAGVQLLTVGQYLRPSVQHLPIERFYTLDDFRDVQAAAARHPFEQIFCGPLVRSSYHADEMAAHVF